MPSELQTLNAWERFHLCSRLLRWPLKLGIVLLVALLALYPRFWLLPTCIARLRDLNSTIDPSHPGLAPLEAAVRKHCKTDDSPRAIRRATEKVVYDAIPYAWDWDTWGVVEYIPNTAEVLAMGREDCDGRAVLAASLLQRMGYEATLVSDLVHVWVATPTAELMSPGTGAKTLRATDEGTKLDLSRSALANVGRSLAYGISVFPLTRELAILAALALTSMQPRSTVRRRVLGASLLLLGLALMRDSGGGLHGTTYRPHLVWIGLAIIFAGWLTLLVKGANRSSRAKLPPRSPATTTDPG